MMECSATPLGLLAAAGAQIKEQKWESVTVRRTRYPDSARLVGFTRLNPCFCFVLQGGCEEVIGAKAIPMPVGSLVFHPRGNVEAFASFGARTVTLHFDLQTPLQETVVLRDYRSEQLGLRLLNESKRKDDFASFALQGLLLEMIAYAGRHAATFPSAPAWLLRARRLIDASISPPTLANLAETVSVHPVHLSKSFPKYFGETLGAYARRHRIETARQRLVSSDASISDIAFEVGFADHSQFTRAFRSATGFTPADYRRANS